MADEDKDQEATEEASGGGMKKMIMLGGIAVVMLVAGIFAGPAIKNMISPPPEDAEAVAEEPADDPPLYTSLHPPLVVNFKDSLGDSHFMQITIEAMSRDQNEINAIREHVAAIRNALILLYSSANYEEVTTREGKQKMLSDGLAEVQRVMTEITGEPSAEALYFTGLVIQ
ncbi:MAG: flagellar basal body-associated FliL family protein [Gammaproteobacteria bacterium]|nr:flagellar basal body-associated FliL family protein [Gammaproteobacteria bacterium]